MRGDEKKPRPLSGEIMSSPAATAPVRADRPDAVDADFEEVGSAAPDRESAANQPAGGENAGPSFLSRAASEPANGSRKAGSGIFWATGVLAAFLAFWMAGGHGLVMEPAARMLRNAPANALRIEDVESSLMQSGDGYDLVVDGTARNHGSVALALPDLVIAVTEKEGATVRYKLGTSRPTLGPGESYAFSSRLAAPTNGVATVTVAFAQEP